MIDLVMGRVDVPQLCREVIATFSHKKRDTAVELRFDENSPQIVIDADKNRIVQVLSNFLTNALKFTTKGSITLSYLLEDESQVRFCVTERFIFQYMTLHVPGMPAGKDEVGTYINVVKWVSDDEAQILIEEGVNNSLK